MRIRRRTLKRIIRENVLTEVFSVPDHLVALEQELQSIAKSQGFDEVAHSVNSFNSGYLGISWTGPDGEEYLVLDQPGKVGPEDQTGGWIWYGMPKHAAGRYDEKTSIQGIKSFARNDGQGRYGDVDVDQTTRNDVIEEVVADFMGMLNEYR
jgi:hypothetical protein